MCVPRHKSGAVPYSVQMTVEQRNLSIKVEAGGRRSVVGTLNAKPRSLDLTCQGWLCRMLVNLCFMRTLFVCLHVCLTIYILLVSMGFCVYVTYVSVSFYLNLPRWWAETLNCSQSFFLCTSPLFVKSLEACDLPMKVYVSDKLENLLC